MAEIAERAVIETAMRRVLAAHAGVPDNVAGRLALRLEAQAALDRLHADGVVAEPCAAEVVRGQDGRPLIEVRQAVARRLRIEGGSR